MRRRTSRSPRTSRLLCATPTQFGFTAAGGKLRGHADGVIVAGPDIGIRWPALTAWCEEHELPYQGVPVGTIKRYATGKGNADSRRLPRGSEQPDQKPLAD